MFPDWQGFPGQRRLIDQSVFAADKAQIGWDDAFKTDFNNVAWDERCRRKCRPLSPRCFSSTPGSNSGRIARHQTRSRP
jgi:hypothetical protein